MKFGVHNPSWLFGPDPAEAFEAVTAKVKWAENHGFVWLSVMSHLIQIGGVGHRTSRSWKAGLSCRHSTRKSRDFPPVTC
jgi:hypothetical protein